MKQRCSLVALLFFPGVGVVDDQVGEGNFPVVSVVVIRPLMVCVSPVKGFVTVPLHVVVSVISLSLGLWASC